MNRVAAVISAVPDFAMAALFLVTWITPEMFEERMVRYLVSVILLEFIIIHSSAFMGVTAVSDLPKKRKLQAIGGLTLVYSLFAGGIALSFSSWWPITAFWGLTVNHLLPVFLGAVPSEHEKQVVMFGWAGSACAYLLFAAVTTLLPLPRLGITAEVVDRQATLRTLG